MKKTSIIAIIFTIVLISTSSQTAFASSAPDETLNRAESTDSYITKTKTTVLQNKEKQPLWSLSVTATYLCQDGVIQNIPVLFTHSAKSFSSSWNILNSSCGFEDGSIIADAVAVHCAPSGHKKAFAKHITLCADEVQAITSESASAYLYSENEYPMENENGN